MRNVEPTTDNPILSTVPSAEKLEESQLNENFMMRALLYHPTSTEHPHQTEHGREYNMKKLCLLCFMALCCSVCFSQENDLWKLVTPYETAREKLVDNALNEWMDKSGDANLAIAMALMYSQSKNDYTFLENKEKLFEALILQPYAISNPTFRSIYNQYYKEREKLETQKTEIDIKREKERPEFLLQEQKKKEEELRKKQEEEKRKQEEEKRKKIEEKQEKYKAECLSFQYLFDSQTEYSSYIDSIVETQYEWKANDWDKEKRERDFESQILGYLYEMASKHLQDMLSQYTSINGKELKGNPEHPLSKEILNYLSATKYIFNDFDYHSMNERYLPQELVNFISTNKYLKKHCSPTRDGLILYIEQGKTSGSAKMNAGTTMAIVLPIVVPVAIAATSMIIRLLKK